MIVARHSQVGGGAVTIKKDDVRRVRFFSDHDLSAGLYVQRVAEVVERYEPMDTQDDLMDVIELHNVQKFIEHGLFPLHYTESQIAFAQSRSGQIRSTVAKYFASINELNCASLIRNVDSEYHADLLDLLGRNKAFDRCNATTMLKALDQIGVNTGEMIACKRLVAAYDTEIRDRLLTCPMNAEHVVRKRLQKDTRDEVHLPHSLTPTDERTLLEQYIDSPAANPNYLGLIESAYTNSETRIDAKLKLHAKRRNAELTENLFERTQGFKTGTEVILSDTQEEPVRIETDDSDGYVVRLTYSRRWFDETADNPSILNNFQHLFEFADWQGILTLPSYSSQLGAVERFLFITGDSHYQVGTAFHAVDMGSLIQTQLYIHYLDQNGKELEDVISWFFDDYIATEFEVQNFAFRRSSCGASYLERVRHLFAELERILRQFALWVDNGELDPELLAMTSDPVQFKKIPSLLPGKYSYPTNSLDIQFILNSLFSDQSSLSYINNDLRSDSAADLILNNNVSYLDFDEHQRPAIDQLIALGVLEDEGSRMRFASAQQFLIFNALFRTEACSYYHLSEDGRATADSMIERGWIERRESLLTEAEANYFNYFLNKAGV